LIDRVQNELLPQDYAPPMEHRIAYHNGTDFMDIYVRKEPSALGISDRK
jgi:hypothetical protein